MKGKYITTSLLIAALSEARKTSTFFVTETTASTTDHTLIWSKTVSKAQQAMLKVAGPDELKTV